MTHSDMSQSDQDATAATLNPYIMRTTIAISFRAEERSRGLRVEPQSSSKLCTWALYSLHLRDIELLRQDFHSALFQVPQGPERFTAVDIHAHVSSSTALSLFCITPRVSHCGLKSVTSL